MNVKIFVALIVVVLAIGFITVEGKCSRRPSPGMQGLCVQGRELYNTKTSNGETRSTDDDYEENEGAYMKMRRKLDIPMPKEWEDWFQAMDNE